MIAIVEKLKRSAVLVMDPDAHNLVLSLLAAVYNNEYKVVSDRQFLNTPGLLNTFVQEFLNSYAYVGDKEGVRLPSYEPFTIAKSAVMTEAAPDIPPMPLIQWVALWSNTFIIYSEYPEAPELDNFLMGMDIETHDMIIKVGKLNE